MPVKQVIRAAVRYTLYAVLACGLAFTLYAWLLGFKQAELAERCDTQTHTFSNGQTYAVVLCFIWNDGANTGTEKSLIRVYDAQNTLQAEYAFQYFSQDEAGDFVSFKDSYIQVLDFDHANHWGGVIKIKIPPTLWDRIYARLP